MRCYHPLPTLKKGLQRPERQAVRRPICLPEIQTSSRAAEVNDRIHLHSLRHSAAVSLAETGEGAFTIQQALGHWSVVVTQGYVHALPENPRLAFEKLGFPSDAAYQLNPAVSSQQLHAFPAEQDGCISG